METTIQPIGQGLPGRRQRFDKNKLIFVGMNMREYTVGDCFYQIRNGANIKQGDAAGGYPITRIETTANDTFNRDRMGYAGITDLAKYEGYVLEDGDLLMSHINSVQYLGRTVLYRKQGDETIIHGMNLLSLKANREIILPEFARYSFRSDPFKKQLSKITKKSVNQASFTVADLKKIVLFVPPLCRQKEIVQNLDKCRSIAAKRQQQLFSLDDLIKARFVEMFGEIIRNDKGWPQYVFSDIASSRLGKMLDAKQQTGKYKHPYLANFNVQWFRFELDNLNEMDFNEADRVEFELKDGDLLVCEGGEIGRCAVWHNEIQPCYFQKALHRVRCNSEIIVPDYLARWFQYNSEQGGFASIEGAKATIAHLPGAKLKALNVTVPPIALQEQFAAFVAQIDKSKSVIQKSLDETQLLFDSLMQKYFG